MKTCADKVLTERQRMLEGTARTLSGNFDLEVIYSEDGECKTDNVRMWLPDSEIIEEEIILSLMAHELGHLKYTDFQSTNTIKSLPYTPEENYVIFHITNVLEDLRIEKEISQAYPGFGRMFLVETARIKNELAKNWPKMPTINRVLIAIYFLMNNKDCEFIEVGYFTAAALLLRDHINFLETCRNTQDILDLALIVFQRLKDGFPNDLDDFIKFLAGNKQVFDVLTAKAKHTENAAKCPHCGYRVGRGEVFCPKCGKEIPPEEENGPGVEYVEGQGGPGGEEIAIDPNGNAPSLTLPDKAFFDDAVIRIDIKGTGGSGAAAKPSPCRKADGRMILQCSHEIVKELEVQTKKFDPVNTKIVSCTDIVKTVVKETIRMEKEKARAAKRKTYYTVHPLLRQEKQRHQSEFDVAPGSDSVYTQIAGSVSKDVRFIQSRLKKILEWDSVHRWEQGFPSGRKLDRRKLCRIPAGERNLFSKKQEHKKKLSIAFTLMIDESGSMGGDNTTEARRATVLFSEVLSSFKIPFEVIGYTTTSFNCWQLNYLRNDLNKASYNAALPLRHDMFKRFDEDFRKVKTRIVNMNAFDGNEDAESLKFGWERLKKRREKHRVLIMIFDSLVNGGLEARNELARIVQEINATPGASAIGIGIQAPYAGDFFTRFVSVTSASQLGENVVRLIESCVADAYC